MTDARTTGLVTARRQDTARRRERVMQALDALARARAEISASSVARQAGVDRSFLYRHPDLLAILRAQAAEPPALVEQTVTRSSLHADLANAHERNTRLAEENQHLRKRLSEALGEEIWRNAGIGAPLDIDTLTRRITELEQQTVELRRELEERAEELEAARAVNRGYLARLNAND